MYLFCVLPRRCWSMTGVRICLSVFLMPAAEPRGSCGGPFRRACGQQELRKVSVLNPLGSWAQTGLIVILKAIHPLRFTAVAGLSVRSPGRVFRSAPAVAKLSSRTPVPEVLLLIRQWKFLKVSNLAKKNNNHKTGCSHFNGLQCYTLI